MDEDSPKSKRQRLPVVSKNEEAKDTHTSSSRGVITLPTGVLSNCFSFLGSSGHYYFLASVCKDFKVAVDELYQGNCNTSIEAIITSMSTIEHVFNVIDIEDEYYVDRMEDRMYGMISEAIYKYDRPDLLEFLGIDKYTFYAGSVSESEDTLNAMISAIKHNSTEIMRSIIVHEAKVIEQCVKTPVWGYYDIKHSILLKISAACDPEMIGKLVEKGVEFDYKSIEYSLTRTDLDTFKCLLDIVQVEDERMKESIILKALQHGMHLDAMKCLKGKKYFKNKNTLVATIWTICSKHFALDFDCLDPILKLLLEGRLDKNDISFLMVLCCCVVHKRMDILSYIHEQIRRIDAGFKRALIQFAEMRNIPDVTNLRRTLSNLP